jgi:Ca2+-binding EF-hand superfamily protein
MMKKVFVRVGLVAAVVSGVAVSAMAQEPTLPRSPRSFDKLDADHNGTLTVSEFQPKAERRFMRLDSNKDGQVSTAEIDAELQKALVKRRNRILEGLDSDGNGSVSKEELDSYIKALIQGADANSDGGVSLDEARKFKVAKMRKHSTDGGAN